MPDVQVWGHGEAKDYEQSGESVRGHIEDLAAESKAGAWGNEQRGDMDVPRLQDLLPWDVNCRAPSS